MARQAAVPFLFVGKADEISRQIHEIRKEAVQIRSDLVFCKSRVFGSIKHFVLRRDGVLLNTLMVRLPS